MVFLQTLQSCVGWIYVDFAVNLWCAFVQSYKIGCTLVKEKGSLLRNYTELGKNTVHLVKDQEKVLCLMWKMSKVWSVHKSYQFKCLIKILKANRICFIYYNHVMLYAVILRANTTELYFSTWKQESEKHGQGVCHLFYFVVEITTHH